MPKQYPDDVSTPAMRVLDLLLALLFVGCVFASGHLLAALARMIA